ncbi:MAG: hypothetical protein Q9208_002968 [Pyrenodesmia sp. 3 TL-2023]
MKRPSPSDIMDLPSPMAKKRHLDDSQANDASTPTTPVDDIDDDDLYGDYPATSKLQSQDAPSQTAHVAPQPLPQESPKHKIFQLPGLGLSLEETSGLQKPLNGGKYVSKRQDNNTGLFVGDSSTAQQAHSSTNAVSVEADGHHEAEDHTRKRQVVEGGHTGESDVNGSSIVLGIDAINGHATGQYPGNIKTPRNEQDEPATAQASTSPTAEGESSSGTILSADDDSMATNTILKPTQPLPSSSGSIEHQSREGGFKGVEVRSADLQRGGAAIPDVVPTAAHLDEETEESVPEPAEELASVEDGVEDRTKESIETKEPDSHREVQEFHVAVPNTTVEPAAQEPTQQPPDPPHGYQQQDGGFNNGILKTRQPESRLETRDGISEIAQTFEEVAEANKEDHGAQFELDSSPIDASSDADSDSDSSSSSSDEEKDKEMIDVAEEARRLMEESGGSDDDGKGNKATSGPLRTLNERPDEVVPMPKIEVTPAMSIAELGNVEHIVENCILIKAKTSGERQALETGSLLCLEDRSVIGLIAEILGQVQQPYYSVRFTNAAAVTEAGVSKGTRVFNVEQHSHYVFTQNIKAFKGSDASNIHDEEVGDDELEFSDDEAEAEHKRRVKQQRQAKRGDRSDRGDGFARGPMGGRMQRNGRSTQANGRIPDPPSISYDDQEDGEDLYTPLARPSNLHEVMGHHEAPQEGMNHRMNGTSAGQEPRRDRQDRRGRADRDRDHRGGGGGRGRGDRGRARGDRRGGGGGGLNEDSRRRQYDNQRQQHPSEQHHARPTPPLSRANYDPTFTSPTNAYQPPMPYGWSAPYPFNQYNNPLYNSSYQQPASSNQQPPYTHHVPTPYEYPQLHNSSPHGSANAFPIQQSPAPLPNHRQYSPHQVSCPATPVLPNIPAGTHINPAFFSPASRQSPPAWPQQQSHGHPPFAGSNNSAESEAASKAAQDRLNLIRQLSQSGGLSL